VTEDEPFPADLLLLQCSDHYGTAYIQTMTLDGERALKPRQAYTEILTQMKEQRIGLDKLRMHLRCEKPNNKIYQFDGQLNFENPKLDPVRVSLDQFLLRGAVLSNTDWIIGIVVYAGQDTKLLRNVGKTKYKQTHIERRLNHVVIFLI
jgi:magnesium-transporting ATPase (P-type)